MGQGHRRSNWCYNIRTRQTWWNSLPRMWIDHLKLYLAHLHVRNNVDGKTKDNESDGFDRWDNVFFFFFSLFSLEVLELWHLLFSFLRITPLVAFACRSFIPTSFSLQDTGFWSRWCSLQSYTHSGQLFLGACSPPYITTRARARISAIRHTETKLNPIR